MENEAQNLGFGLCSATGPPKAEVKRSPYRLTLSIRRNYQCVTCRTVGCSLGMRACVRAGRSAPRL